MAPWRSSSLSKPPLLAQFANKIDDPSVHLFDIHRLHRIRVHTRDDFTIIIEHVHVSRRMIADPPDENVTRTTNASSTMHTQLLVSSSSMTRAFFTPELNRWIAPSIHFASDSMLRSNSSCLAGSRYQ